MSSGDASDLFYESENVVPDQTGLNTKYPAEQKLLVDPRSHYGISLQHIEGEDRKSNKRPKSKDVCNDLVFNSRKTKMKHKDTCETDI